MLAKKPPAELAAQVTPPWKMPHNSAAGVPRRIPPRLAVPAMGSRAKPIGAFPRPQR
ncbi:MAG: hypothetical protein GY772_24615 [bacterium]|nr:hypothetical protein [bacterium]